MVRKYKFFSQLKLEIEGEGEGEAQFEQILTMQFKIKFTSYFLSIFTVNLLKILNIKFQFNHVSNSVKKQINNYIKLYHSQNHSLLIFY